jgi:hypothetical protein
MKHTEKATKRNIALFQGEEVTYGHEYQRQVCCVMEEVF